jgi:hypothetical protein
MPAASTAALSPPELNTLMASMFTPTARIHRPAAPSPNTQQGAGDHPDGVQTIHACGEGEEE